MEDLVKKVLYTGVGLVATTTEKLQSTVNGLVDSGKVPQEEGKKIVDDFVSSTETKRNEFESRATDLIESIVRRLEVPTKSDYEALSKRIAKLERAARTSKTVDTAAAGKSTASKSTASSTKK